jgi:hypothetical protein
MIVHADERAPLPLATGARRPATPARSQQLTGWVDPP